MCDRCQGEGYRFNNSSETFGVCLKCKGIPMLNNYPANRYYQPAILPNQEGFEFIGRNHLGEEGLCKVAINSVGMHFVTGAFGFLQLADWRNLNKDEK